MYCPIHGHGIGVLVADNPFGPFKDPIGKPLAWEGDWFDIDPTVWIDDDNQPLNHLKSFNEATAPRSCQFTISVEV